MNNDPATEHDGATVYIPRDPVAALASIAPGSGIVGAPLGESGIVIFFEGNCYDASNLRDYEDRLACAAGRLFTRYPTVAKMYVPLDEVTARFIAVAAIDRNYRITYLSEDLKERALVYGALCTNTGA